MAIENVSLPRPVARARVPHHTATIIADQMCQLWQVSSILELAIAAMGDERDTGGPPMKPALQTAAALLRGSINALEPILEVRS